MKKPTTNSGSSLMAVLMLIAIMALMIAAIYSATTGEAKLMKRNMDRTAAICYGNGILESLFDQWRIAMTDTTHLNSTQRTSGLTTNELMTGTATSPATTIPSNLPLTVPTSTQLPLPPGVALSSWKVSAADPYLAAMSSGTSRPSVEAGTTSRLRVRLYYIAVVTMTFPGGTVSLERVFTRAGRNIFDNFLFSTQPTTEINPGAPMYVNGTVYVGGDLYMAHSDLHLQQDVSYTGNKYMDFKGGHGISSSYADSRYGSETPSITSSAWPASNPPHQGAQQKLLDTAMSNLDDNYLDDIISNDTNSDNNPNNDGYHELVEEVDDATKPDALQTDTNGGSERLSVNADYRIYVDASNNVTIYKGTSTSALSTSNSEYVAIKAAITTNNSIYDAREGDNVRLVGVDVGLLNTAYTTGKIVDSVGSSDGFLFYIKDTSAGTSVTTKGYQAVVTSSTTTSHGKNVVTSSTSSATANLTSSKSRGIRLTDAGTLPSVGLSIVSPNAVFIQGDYNTGSTTSGSSPPSNASSAYSGTTDPNPYVSGYSRVASVVVGDSVNILSNAWTDSNAVLAQNAGGAPDATRTTINTAIVAGNVPTTSSSYSGGIENFPRFHEDWSGGVYLTLYGSIALLYDSEQAKGTWSNANYSPPDRHWYFDTTLQDKNPPGFPVAYTYDRGRWFTR